jgi:hypothetical protein
MGAALFFLTIFGALVGLCLLLGVPVSVSVCIPIFIFSLFFHVDEFNDADKHGGTVIQFSGRLAKSTFVLLCLLIVGEATGSLPYVYANVSVTTICATVASIVLGILLYATWENYCITPDGGPAIGPLAIGYPTPKILVYLSIPSFVFTVFMILNEIFQFWTFP